jgi:hypothetical protein
MDNIYPLQVFISIVVYFFGVFTHPTGPSNLQLFHLMHVHTLFENMLIGIMLVTEADAFHFTSQMVHPLLGNTVAVGVFTDITFICSGNNYCRGSIQRTSADPVGVFSIVHMHLAALWTQNISGVVNNHTPAHHIHRNHIGAQALRTH